MSETRLGKTVILIVDDFEDHRAVFATTLGHFGYSVLVAADGASAIAEARLHLPSLIVMDLGMPVLSGWSAVEFIRGDPTTSSIPVLALSIHEPPLAALRSAGFCAYMRKPVFAGDLVKAIELCLHARSRNKQWIDIPRIDPAASSRYN